MAARKQDDDVWLSMIKSKTAFVSTPEFNSKRIKATAAYVLVIEDVRMMIYLLMSFITLP